LRRRWSRRRGWAGAVSRHQDNRGSVYVDIIPGLKGAIFIRTQQRAVERGCTQIDQCGDLEWRLPMIEDNVKVGNALRRKHNIVRGVASDIGDTVRVIEIVEAQITRGGDNF
jgi:hypothetical protein